MFCKFKFDCLIFRNAMGPNSILDLSSRQINKYSHRSLIFHCTWYHNKLHNTKNPTLNIMHKFNERQVEFKENKTAYILRQKVNIIFRWKVLAAVAHMHL